MTEPQCFDGPCVPASKYVCRSCAINPMRKIRVYYGMGGSGTDKKLGGGYVENICISAANLWANGKFRSWKPPKHDSLFIDSGGYSFFSIWGEYPFSCQQYVEMAKTYEPDFIAIRDYPCEPDVARLANLKTNKQRIDATIRNAQECLQYDMPWVIVIQGYRLSEYQYCCDRYKDAGIRTDLIAIGSLCVRKQISDVRRIIRLVRKNFPNAKLHGFGIDFRFLKDPFVREELWSVDTSAWTHNSSSDRRFASSSKELLLNFDNYVQKVNELLQMYDHNSRIDDWASKTEVRQ